MQAKAKSLLCALLTLGVMVSAANAQVVHSVSQQNNEVTQYGLTEVMGEIRYTHVSGATISSSITATYIGAQISNLPAAGTATAAGGVISYDNGITITGTGAYATAINSTIITASGANTTLGGQVIISIGGGGVLTPTAGDYLAINGARTDVSAKSVGSSITATITSSPSNANLFDLITVTVATVNSAMSLAVSGVSNASCVAATNPNITITEGFAGSFVEYTTPGAGGRPRYGATVDTQVSITVNSLPTGTTLSWPATVAASAASASGAILTLNAGSTDALAVYTFTTTNQGTSDSLAETFIVTPIVTHSATTAYGQSTVQAQLWPNVATTTVGYSMGLINTTADNFINVTKCVTYLLYPYVTCQATTGFTTGLAIANTSLDDAAFGTGLGATAQVGAVTIYGYPKSVKAADGTSGTLSASISAIISPSLSAGDMHSVTCDAVTGFSGFEGYVIAKAEFEFAHGFAFVVGQFNTGSVFDVAHGYLALVIPDPSISARAASATGGETLGQ